MGHFLGTTCLLLLLTVSASNAQIFNIKQFGAKGDGNTDDSLAITKAWAEACKSASPGTVVVPGGKFKVGPLLFKGPCKAATINFKLEGTLLAHPEPNKFNKKEGWVDFQYLKGLTLSGGGVFNGQGAMAWKQNDCAKTGKCSTLPMNIRFTTVSDSLIQGVTSLDSKLFHINLLGCTNVAFKNVKIIAPAESLNTDGIHVGRSTNITITDTDIKTGDDCLSFGDGTKQVTVERVKCGPGHGISVGSLGRYPNEEPVKGITIKGCTLTGTDNGVRIKTWPASPAGSAEDMTFDGVTMNNVGNPILIDQYYCPYSQCNAKVPSRVRISNVIFKNIKGTSTTKSTMKISCSPALPCQNVKIIDVNLKYSGKDGPAVSQCANVKPVISGSVFPPACTQKATFP